jgi:hypothetical protein
MAPGTLLRLDHWYRINIRREGGPACDRSHEAPSTPPHQSNADLIERSLMLHSQTMSGQNVY